jgi:streptogramin lyase
VALIPYLFYAPSSWTLSLVYGGGGFYAVGGAAIDVEGNFWTNNNWMPGSQTTIYRQFGGGSGKFAPNGKPLSPMITGFRGGGLDSPGWGIAFSSDDKVWLTNLIGRTISVLDRNTGAPLSPETGYNFDGKLGQMQGILVAPNGDIWTVDNGNSQIVHIPAGDPSQGRILGQTVDGKPVDGTLRVKGPFGIAIDQQDRIWITNSSSNTLTRFPASDPGNAEEIEVGFSPHAIAIDSQRQCLGRQPHRASGHEGEAGLWSSRSSKASSRRGKGRCRLTLSRPTCGSICGTSSAKIPAAMCR